MHESFDPSELSMGARFRKSIHSKDAFSTPRLDHAQTLLASALEKHAREHPGEDTLTKHNFDKVMVLMQKDPGYAHLYSAGPALEKELRAHLGIKEPEAEG